MNCTVPQIDWLRKLPEIISKTSDGDKIICSTDATAELGRKATSRMYSDKKIIFEVLRNDSIRNQN